MTDSSEEFCGADEFDKVLYLIFLVPILLSHRVCATSILELHRLIDLFVLKFGNARQLKSWLDLKDKPQRMIA
jgi:hypothetical protein